MAEYFKVILLSPWQEHSNSLQSTNTISHPKLNSHYHLINQMIEVCSWMKHTFRATPSLMSLIRCQH